jgi:hypothetical protein
MSRKKASEDTEAELQSTESTQVEPKIKLRSQKAIHHHLFKALVARMKKNIAWRKGQPDIREVEHVHFFHTVNSFGMDQEHTNEVGGHFHAVTWSVGDDGELRAVCGPALKKISKRGRDGYPVTKIVPVQWENKFKEDEDESDFVTDTHTHVMSYEGSDVITSSQIKQIAKQSEKFKQQQAAKAALPKPEEVGLVDNDR